MSASRQYLQIYEKLYSVYGECVCPLKHKTPFQLLAAVMLSAQCRDERVNIVTEKLFAVAPDAASMAEMPVSEIEKIIHPCGLSRNKSRNLHDCAVMLVTRYDSEVPRTMEELIQLPGIGRKSANVILGNAFHIPGFPVDTHVKRLLNRIGMVKSDSPEKIEYAVTGAVPEKLWTNFSHLLIQHGRQICFSRNPQCDKCVIGNICKKISV
ncbi:MAG: endonuclease III [Lentisphaeria bacterium]|nr:endonuclease III [Lentisphaeria bacterium]